jgi:hypothetical protein
MQERVEQPIQPIGEVAIEPLTGWELFAIRLNAASLITAGVSSILSMIVEFLSGNSTFDLSFICLFFGIGLLEWKETSRGWAIFILWIELIVCSVIGVYLLNQTLHGNNILDEPWETFIPRYLTWGTWGLGVGWCYWQLKVMMRRRVRVHFSLEGKGPDLWWKVIAVCTAVTFLFSDIEKKMTDKMISSVEIYQAQIEVFDADTGARLFPGWTDSASDSRNLFPRGRRTISRLTSDQGILLDLAWVDYKPVTVTIDSNGYESKEVIIASKYPGEKIRVELKKQTREPSRESPKETDPNKVEQALKKQFQKINLDGDATR